MGGVLREECARTKVAGSSPYIYTSIMDGPIKKTTLKIVIKRGVQCCGDTLRRPVYIITASKKLIPFNIKFG
jgi:hypothetical protein